MIRETIDQKKKEYLEKIMNTYGSIDSEILREGLKQIEIENRNNQL